MAAGDPNDLTEAGRLTEATYIQLVCSLFKTIVPTIIMAVSFAAVGIHIVATTSDMVLLCLLVFGLIAAVARVAILLLYRTEAAQEGLGAIRAGEMERRFALPYYSFALAFGLFAAWSFKVAPPDGQLLIVGLLFGYGAGVAAGISLRPWISIPSVIVAIVPTIISTFILPRPGEPGVGVLTAVFLAGGIESMLRRYRETSRLISTQHILSSMDRRDELTGLPNNIALRVHFEPTASTGAAMDIVALHCIAIDGLKEINTLHGHRAGDALLKAAAERLSRCLQPKDLGARLGGLEFAAVQPAISHPQQAEALAREIQAALTQPYSIAGAALTVEVAVGYAFTAPLNADIDMLIDGARKATKRARSTETKVARFNRPKWS